MGSSISSGCLSTDRYRDKDRDKERERERERDKDRERDREREREEYDGVSEVDTYPYGGNLSAPKVREYNTVQYNIK
jgi:hypothetical protein